MTQTKDIHEVTIKQRVKWVDYAKGMAIVAVLLLHLPIAGKYQLIADAVVMPLFFYLSGMFDQSEKYDGYVSFIRKRGVYILLPYFVFGFLTYVFWLIVGRHYGLSSEDNIQFWEPLVGMLNGTYYGLVHYIPLWFFPCFFVVNSMSCFLYRLFPHAFVMRIVVAFILFVAGIAMSHYNVTLLPWNINGACCLLFYYLMGKKSRTSVLKNVLQLSNKMLLLVFFILAAVSVSLALSNTRPMYFINEYGSVLLAFGAACCGVASIMLLCILIENVFPTLRFLLFVGENSLVILVTHLTIFTLIKGFAVFVCGFSLEIFYSPEGKICLLMTAMLLLVPVILFLNRFFPVLVGKKKISFK